MPSGYLGCVTLTTKLSRVLFTHIKYNLPEIMGEIKTKLKETKDELTDLGEPMPTTKGEKLHVVWAKITEFV